MNKYIWATVMAFAVPQAAFGQTIPNYGNYQNLNGPFRVGINIVNAANNFRQMQSFEQTTIEDITDYLDPSQIATVVGPQNAQQALIQQVFDLRGATALAGYQQNSTTLSVSFVTPDGEVITQSNGGPCSFSFDGQSRQESFDTFDALVDDEASATSQAIQNCISRSFARFSPIDPLAGNPGSLQSSMARSALDLSVGDSLIEEEDGTDGANTAGDPWIVGATYTLGSAGRFDIERFDGRVQRSFRIFEGNRAQLKFDLPITYSRISGSSVYSAQLGVGLEYPVIAKKWSLEPRIAYGAVYSEDAGSVGNIVQVSVTSRYVVGGLGRGRLVIGNMIGYSTTLDPIGTQTNLNPDLKNTVLRNGLAYELPLKARLGGRSASVRASYGFTKFLGSDLFNDNFHEATLSFGLRGREESVRATRDLIRFNLNAILAKGYHSYSAGVGFRF